MSDIQGDAIKIAKMIIDTDSDDRGLLFSAVAQVLSNYTQYYTASLFTKIANQYGIPK